MSTYLFSGNFRVEEGKEVTEASLQTALAGSMFAADSAIEGIQVAGLRKSSDLAEELLKSLQEGIACFYFRKADGTLRKAVGTLNQELISKFYPPSNGSDKTASPHPTNVTYFDLEVKGFRVFSRSAIVSIF